MYRADLINCEKTLMAEVVKRRNLGGYSTDAEGILIIAETLLRMLGYLIDNYPLMVELADMTAKSPPKKKKSAKKKTK